MNEMKEKREKHNREIAVQAANRSGHYSIQNPAISPARIHSRPNSQQPTRIQKLSLIITASTSERESEYLHAESLLKSLKK